VSHLELEVLACLAATPGVVWSHEELHEAAWGTRYVGDRDSVYSLVKRLRRKLAERGVGLDLVAVRGVGFQLVPHPVGEAAPLDTPRLARWQGGAEPA
jgi:two-component system response regulator VicR